MFYFVVAIMLYYFHPWQDDVLIEIVLPFRTDLTRQINLTPGHQHSVATPTSISYFKNKSVLHCSRHQEAFNKCRFHCKRSPRERSVLLGELAQQARYNNQGHFLSFDDN